MKLCLSIRPDMTEQETTRFQIDHLTLFTCLYISFGMNLPGLEVIKLEFILRLKMKRNDWLLADTCSQAANQCDLFWVWDCSQVL